MEKSEAEAVIPLTVHVAMEQDGSQDESGSVPAVRWQGESSRTPMPVVQRYGQRVTLFATGVATGVTAMLVAHLPTLLIGVVIGVLGMAFIVHKK